MPKIPRGNIVKIQVSKRHLQQPAWNRGDELVDAFGGFQNSVGKNVELQNLDLLFVGDFCTF